MSFQDQGLSNSHKLSHQFDALSIKTLVAFLIFMRSHIRYCEKYYQLQLPTQYTYQHQYHHKWAEKKK